DALVSHLVAAVYLRCAVEIGVWSRALGEIESLGPALAVGILSCHTAWLYMESMINHERKLCRRDMPSWFYRHLNAVADLCSFDPREEEAGADLPLVSTILLKLQGRDNVPESALTEEATQEAWEIVRQGLPATAPVENLLTSGGDARIRIDGAKGLNSYGCSPRPRPWAVTFASSTASSISTYAFKNAEKLRRILIKAACRGELDVQYVRELERVRSGILAGTNLKLHEDVEVAITTSGTDAELIALFAVLSRGEEPVTNIIAGLEETGSGVEAACKGCHFDSQTPMGEIVQTGGQIEGLPADRVKIAKIPIRNETGSIEPREIVDRKVRQLAESSLADGSRALLHLVHRSKTGIQAPSVESAYRVSQEYPSKVDVLVDDCQMRISDQTVERYVRAGFMVIVTGSKFFTGPPFSGALILPSHIADRVKNGFPVPAGFSGYFGLHQLPRSWARSATQLTQDYNLGLLLRWRAALREIEAFRAVPDEAKCRILSRFREAIRRVLNRNPDITMLSPAECRTGNEEPELEWEDVQTIFSFTVLGPQSNGIRKSLSVTDARKIYHWLNRDISPFLPETASEEELQLARILCHIGQPLALASGSGDLAGALRLSSGGRLVSSVYFRRALGRSVEERLLQQITGACLAIDKVSLIVTYLDYLDQQLCVPKSGERVSAGKPQRGDAPDGNRRSTDS
ncbi:MAG: hypothetical protein P8182_08170, partial [Deltaproteobacteria bacterium]